MTHRPKRAGTALAATLSLLLPQAALVPGAQAQASIRLCQDLATTPPCPEGEPEGGTAFLVGEDATLTPVPDEGGDEEATEGAVEEAPAEVAPAEEAPVEEAGEAEAEVAEAEAQAAEEAAQAEADAQAAAEEEAARQAEEQAEVEAQATAADEDAARQALEQAEAEAEAAVEAEAQAAAEAEAQAAADEDAAQQAQEQAEAEADEQAEVETQAEPEAQAEAEDAEADAEAEAQAESEAAQAAAEAEAQAVEDAIAAEDAQAQADADVQAQADAQAERDAAREAIRAEREARRAARQADTEAEAPSDAAPEGQAEDQAEEVPAQDAEPAPAEEIPAEEDATDPTVEEDAGPVAAISEDQGAVEEEVETVAREDVRVSDEDFATEAGGEAGAGAEDDDEGLSAFEKALLAGLGAVAVGALLDNGAEVVANSGDRVVTRAPTGDLVIYRDDDALLRQEGSTVRTQTFEDGSTRTVVERGDGTGIVTIRDAEGRVLRRARTLADGSEVVLLDDTDAPEPVDVRTLRARAPAPVSLSAQGASEASLRRALEEPAAFDPGRTFTLRQVREIALVRNLVPGIDLDAITFASGSAAIPASQLDDLVDLGFLIEDALDVDPAEVFLVEGHTDAVGPEALNLALSDRRAESVALALTENFAIPPENLVVQGYGEAFLKVPTEEAEQENRRATIRRITPLLRGE